MSVVAPCQQSGKAAQLASQQAHTCLCSQLSCRSVLADVSLSHSYLLTHVAIATTTLCRRQIVTSPQTRRLIDRQADRLLNRNQSGTWWFVVVCLECLISVLKWISLSFGPNESKFFINSLWCLTNKQCLHFATTTNRNQYQVGTIFYFTTICKFTTITSRILIKLSSANP